ncbi:RSM18 37S ribosomal protein RSM18 [Candida maltosa Xu316]
MKSRSQWAQKDLSDTSSQEDLIDNLGKISETTATKVEPPIYISPSLHRNFRMGDTYTPFDFSMNRFDMEHKIKASKKLVDPFATSGINPKYLYLMPELLSKYLTSTGQILPRSATGCSAANQVKLAKAVETARCLGLLSTKHRHARYLPVRNL